MPNFDVSFLACCYNKVLAFVEDGVENLAETLDFILSSMSKHSFKVRERTDGFVALVFIFKTIFQNLFHLVFIEI